MREARIIIDYDGQKRKLCKVFFTQGDSSIYVFPYWHAPSFYCGKKDFASGQAELTFDYSRGTVTRDCPKLSYHESGRVHLKNGNNSLVHVDARALNSHDEGDVHLFSMVVTDISLLPLLRARDQATSETDHVIFSTVDDLVGVRIAVYGRTGNIKAMDGCQLLFNLRRDSACPAYCIGVKMVAQVPLARPGTPEGTAEMMLIGGWDPDAYNVTTPASFIYLVGGNPA